MVAVAALRTHLENIIRDCVEIIPSILQNVIRIERNVQWRSYRRRVVDNDIRF